MAVTIALTLNTSFKDDAFAYFPGILLPLFGQSSSSATQLKEIDKLHNWEPIFIQTRSNITVMEGEMAYLNCRVYNASKNSVRRMLL